MNATALPAAPDNVVARLRRRIAAARAAGIEVRFEPMHDCTPDWCQIATRSIIFLDSAAVAGEQLATLNELLDRILRPTSQTKPL